MISKCLAVFVIFNIVTSLGSNGEPWDEIISNKNNLENTRLSRQKSSKSYVSNPLISTVEIPLSVFPDVTYPTSIMDTREPYYFTTNAFDDVLKPFSEDVKSSYKALKSGKVQSTSPNNSPLICKNNNQTMVIANTNINNNISNELKEDIEYEKDRLLGTDLKDGTENILNDMTQYFDRKDNETTLASNFTGTSQFTEILKQDIQNNEENVTQVCFDKLPGINVDLGAIEELYSEENGSFNTEFPNKLHEAKIIFNTILTTLQNFQKTGMFLTDSQPHNNYDDTSPLETQMKNQIEVSNSNNISKHELNLKSNDRNNNGDSKVLIKELSTEKTATDRVRNNKKNCEPIESNSQLGVEKDAREESSSSSDENEFIHIYVANENNSDFDIKEILIDNSEELNIKSAASTLSIFDF